MKVQRLSILVMLASCVPAFAESPERIKAAMDAITAKTGVPSWSQAATVNGRDAVVFVFDGGRPGAVCKVGSFLDEYLPGARVDAASVPGVGKDAVVIDAGKVGRNPLAVLRISFGIDPVNAVPIQPVVPAQDVTPLQPSRP